MRNYVDWKGFWSEGVGSSAVRTETSTGVTVTAGQFSKFRIETNSALTQATYYIDDVLVATITTNLPTGATKLVGPGVIIAKSLGTTARTLDVDYVDIIANVANSGR
jgi:hypothetical protein